MQSLSHFHLGSGENKAGNCLLNESPAGVMCPFLALRPVCSAWAAPLSNLTNLKKVKCQFAYIRFNLCSCLCYIPAFLLLKSVA